MPVPLIGTGRTLLSRVSGRIELLPASVANLAVDLDPGLGVFSDAGVTPITVDATACQQWNDQSGAGVIPSVSQATLGNRPLWKTAIFGSFPSLLFDGTDDIIQHAGGALPAALQVNDYTYLAVVKDMLGGAVVHLGDTAVGHQTLRSNGANPNRINGASFTSGGNDATTGAINNLRVGTFVVGMRRSVSENRIDLLANGALDGSDTALLDPTAVYGTSKSFKVGGQLAGTFPLSGHLGRLLVWPRALTAAEWLGVSRYLGTRYGAVVV